MAPAGAEPVQSVAAPAAATGSPAGASRQPIVQPLKNPSSRPVGIPVQRRAAPQQAFPVSGYGNVKRARAVKTAQIRSTPSGIPTQPMQIIPHVAVRPLINAIPPEAIVKEHTPVGADEKK